MPNEAKPSALLASLKIPHRVVDGDCWYSCPKSGECCDDSRINDKCDCGADEHNARVDCAVNEREELRGALEAMVDAWVKGTVTDAENAADRARRVLAKGRSRG